ncbi:FMN reductase [Murinocardiopsis flavida]|uniref:FMN reductase n=1 Tax=Murinocardiopsis flavida TaxID=645275 RepID=A0A2P8DIV2_9ACTN|nr:NAD(P)H-dependent oxidoreductase [Murinocardiopsis flavida]PSK97153.1 FMN reductase [Murinocardiopsis flavida]
MTTFTVLVADPSPDTGPAQGSGSRSGIRAAAVRAARAVSPGLAAAPSHIPAPIPTSASTSTLAEPQVVDLAELGPALLTSDPSERGAVAAALDLVSGSDFLLIATPQVHGGYTGLLKVFLDRLPELGLAQTVALPMAVVDDLRNGRNVEEDLRVVLSELGAWVLEPGLLLSRGELGEPHRVIGAWAEIAAPALREAVAIAA